jgi:glycosyltransferase involved in cell wall biosynthesis
MSGAPNHFLDAAIIIETFNLREDTAFDRLRAALDYADELRRRYNGVEVILADASDIENPNEAALARLILNYPRLRTVRVPGAGYDGIKHAAILSTTARHVVFLDSDCLPDSDLWLGALVGPIQRGLAEATTGTTVYEPETLWAQVLSILDFGFLLESTGGTVSCYTSNNAAFLRERWLTTPPPDGALRCTCYGHARELMQQNAAILHVAEATARHEMKSFWSERWRRGYDLVAVCWIDRYLREARWVHWRCLCSTAKPLPKTGGA